MTTQASLDRSMRYLDWELRPLERQLIVRGVCTPIGSRAFDVLLALTKRPGQIVSRNELLDAAWQGLVVEENNLSVQVVSLRKVLGAHAITTVPGLGYCLSAAPEDFSPRSIDLGLSRQTARSPSGNLPRSSAELIGRDDDLSGLAAMVRRHRVVNVVGAGGVGKTRLAQAVAQRLQAEYPDGAWMVELASLTDPGLLPAAVAQALGMRLPGQKSTHAELFEALRDSALLLVLDNCEHMVESVRDFVHALISETQGLAILSTSQTPLKLPAEHVYRLASLSVPSEGDGMAITQHSALRLLMARVRALDRSFEIDEHNAADAVEVCRRLDGLPLAIELAAARVPLLGLAGVCELLGERFRLLTDGPKTGSPRHVNLRTTLEWSYSLLNPDERSIFMRASVFVGGFGMQQAQQALSDEASDEWTVLELLAALVDKSLIIVETTGAPRYRLLESARAYAFEMLQEAGGANSAMERHAQAMNKLLETAAELEWRLPSQLRLQRFLPDLDNVRAALKWAEQAAPAIYASLAAAAVWIFSASGQTGEGRAHCRRAIEQVDTSTPTIVEARLQHEFSCLMHDDSSDEKLMAAKRAVDLYRGLSDAAALYRSLGQLAVSASLCGDHETGLAAVAEMTELWNPQWPLLARWELLHARDFVANLLSQDDEEGQALAEQQLALATRAGDTFKTLFAMMALEQCAATRRDYAEAVTRGRELVTRARQERYVAKLHIYVANLATALVMAGEPDEALPLAREAKVMDARYGSLWQSLDMIAMLAFRRGRAADAAIVLGRADAANAWRGGDKREPVERDVRNDLMAELAAVLTAADLARYLSRGARMTDEEAADTGLRD